MNQFSSVLACVVGLAALSGVARANFEKGDEACVHLLGAPPAERERITGIYAIGEDGMIRLPLIDPIPAAGLNAAQLGMAAEKAYRDAGIYLHPAVSVEKAVVGKICELHNPPRISLTS